MHSTKPRLNNTHTNITILRLSALCPGQPGWASTRRNIHPLTPIVVISQPLSASSIYYNPWHPPCSIYMPYSLFPQSLSKFSLVYLLAWHPPLTYFIHFFNQSLSSNFSCSHTCGNAMHCAQLEATQRWLAICRVWSWTCVHIACAHRYVVR